MLDGSEIVAINGERVVDLEEFQAAMVRAKKNVFVTLKVSTAALLSRCSNCRVDRLISGRKTEDRRFVSTECRQIESDEVFILEFDGIY